MREAYEAAFEAYIGKVGVFMQGDDDVAGFGRIGRFMPKSGRFYLDGVPSLKKAGTPHWCGPRRGHDSGGAWAEVSLLAFAFDTEAAARAFVAAITAPCAERRTRGLAAMREESEAVSAARRQFEPLIAALQEEYATRMRELTGRRDALVAEVRQEAERRHRGEAAAFNATLTEAAGQPRIALEHKFWLYGRPYEGRVPLAASP